MCALCPSPVSCVFSCGSVSSRLMGLVSMRDGVCTCVLGFLCLQIAYIMFVPQGNNVVRHNKLTHCASINYLLYARRDPGPHARVSTPSRCFRIYISFISNHADHEPDCILAHSEPAMLETFSRTVRNYVPVMIPVKYISKL